MTGSNVLTGNVAKQHNRHTIQVEYSVPATRELNKSSLDHPQGLLHRFEGNETEPRHLLLETRESTALLPSDYQPSDLRTLPSTESDDRSSNRLQPNRRQEAAVATVSTKEPRNEPMVSSVSDHIDHDLHASATLGVMGETEPLSDSYPQKTVSNASQAGKPLAAFRDIAANPSLTLASTGASIGLKHLARKFLTHWGLFQIRTGSKVYETNMNVSHVPDDSQVTKLGEYRG